MKNKVTTYRSKAEDIIFTVIQEPSNDRTSIVFYLNVFDSERNIELKEIRTIVNLDGQDDSINSIDHPHDVANFLNGEENSPKDTVKTEFKFVYTHTEKELPFTEMINYMLPLDRHGIVVMTEDETIIT